MLVQAGIINFGPDPRWDADLFDPSVHAPNTRNLSDDEKYDNQFPDHPLSRARKILEQVLKTLKVDEAVLKSDPFGQ